MSSRLVAASCALLICTACARKSPPPAPPPGATPVPTEGIRVTEVVTRSPRSLESDTGRLAEARRAAMARAEAAARLVDTIVATPDTIVLEAGESIGFFNLVRFTGRDSTGAEVPGLAPRLLIVDQNIARFAGGELTGISVGTTMLRIEPTVPGAPRGERPRTRTEIPVVVRPSGRAGVRASVDSVPRDLVVALLGSGVRPVSLRVGAPAEGLPDGLFRDGRVLGSANVGNTATTVVVMPLSVRVVLDTIDARLAAAGWTPPRPPPGLRGARGFVPAQTTLGGYGPGQACRNGEHISSLIRAQSPNETLVVLSRQRNLSPYGPCADSVAAPRNPMEDVPVPLLSGPADAELQSQGTSGGSDSWESRARLLGGAPSPRMLEHFAAQLQRQGWTVTDSATSRDLATQIFRHVGSDGKQWLGVLTILTLRAPDVRQASFRIVRVDP